MSLPSFTFYDKDNILVILVKNSIFKFNGEKWENILINDNKIPDSDFPMLQKPCLCEIFEKDKKKKFLVTGGFNSKSKSASKTVYVINIVKDAASLDFGFGDMKEGRFLHSSVNIDNKYIIVIGGKNGPTSPLSSCEYLDIKNAKWDSFPQLSENRFNFSSCMIDNNIYLYGGYESNGKFVSDLMIKCEININKITESQWKPIHLKSKELPAICSGVVRYEESLMIIGGSTGKEIVDGIYEIDPVEGNVQKLGKIKVGRSNMHMLLKDGDFYCIGGAIKEYQYNEDKTKVENYGEKFTFDVNNEIISEYIPIQSNDIIKPLIDNGVEVSEYKTEPGFPYSASLLTKEF